MKETIEKNAVIVNLQTEKGTTLRVLLDEEKLNKTVRQFIIDMIPEMNKKIEKNEDILKPYDSISKTGTPYHLAIKKGDEYSLIWEETNEGNEKQISDCDFKDGDDIILKIGTWVKVSCDGKPYDLLLKDNDLRMSIVDFRDFIIDFLNTEIKDENNKIRNYTADGIPIKRWNLLKGKGASTNSGFRTMDDTDDEHRYLTINDYQPIDGYCVKLVPQPVGG